MFRSRYKPLALVFCLQAAAACVIGRTVDDFRPAQRPAGVYAQLTLDQGEFHGELLAVEEQGLLLVVDREGAGASARPVQFLARISFAVVQRAEFDQVGSGRNVLRDLDFRARVRLLSRYPQGVSDDLLARLEGAYGDTRTFEPGGAP